MMEMNLLRFLIQMIILVFNFFIKKYDNYWNNQSYDFSDNSSDIGQVLYNIVNVMISN
jgi:hypothetical protein